MTIEGSVHSVNTRNKEDSYAGEKRGQGAVGVPHATQTGSRRLKCSDLSRGLFASSSWTAVDPGGRKRSHE